MLILTKKLLSRMRGLLPKKLSDQDQRGKDAEPSQVSPVTGAPDSYRGVILVILAGAIFGSVGVLIGGVVLMNWVVLDAGLSVVISMGILAGVAFVQAKRAKLPANEEGVNEPSGAAKWVSMITGFIGISGCLMLFRSDVFSDTFGFRPEQPHALIAGITVLLCGVAAGLAATVAHYLSDVNSTEFPESVGLSQGSSILAWIFGFAGASAICAWIGWEAAVEGFHFTVLTINAAVSFSLFAPVWSDRFERTPRVFPLDLGIFSLLGGRANLFASVIDTAQRKLGIDLRSSWALTVVRRSAEPLILGLIFLGWLSTTTTVVGVGEQGLIERLGVPVRGTLLLPGLHLHWPWPIDRVLLVSTQRVRTIEVGHEGEEGGGPENVLWAVEHAPNEYSLVLGNGRDLVTIDAAIQFQITDARAWQYNTQNPEDALRAIALRAVMRSTVDKTLSEALSENLTKLTTQMKQMVQADADTLNLGVQVLAFTVGGMHPPVPVAEEYEAVISAQLGKVTAVVNANAYRNETVPEADASVVRDENKARADGAETLGEAAGQAWSFRALESQYHASPQEFRFRRRLETLESGLADHPFTVLDSRFERDGGEIWLTR